MPRWQLFGQTGPVPLGEAWEVFWEILGKFFGKVRANVAASAQTLPWFARGVGSATPGPDVAVVGSAS
jgi:hypothetical protein